MFQYAAARALSIRTHTELVLDTRSGFERDRTYRRTYQLDRLPITGSRASRTLEVPFIFADIRRRIHTQPTDRTVPGLLGDLIQDSNTRFITDLESAKVDVATWVEGYWQSPRYFERFRETIARELQPGAPQSSAYRVLGAEMSEGNSVAIGVRLYEESPNPASHSSNGRMKTPEEIEGALHRALANVSDPRLFVFCSSELPGITSIKWPVPPTYVTPQRGFDDAVDTLWLLSRARHHVITNSSFYWWGAWLSGVQRQVTRQVVIASDNFINRDALEPEWLTF
jgi:hypothetical protein